MPRKPRKELCFTTITMDELALLSRFGSAEAERVLWSKSLPIVNRIAGHFHGKYPWVERDDIAQSVALEFPKIIRRFKPELAPKGVSYYLYFSFYRAAQDHMRREDPLGVRIPQKRKYPKYFHLSGEDLVSCDFNRVVSNIDRGYIPRLPE